MARAPIGSRPHPYPHPYPHPHPHPRLHPPVAVMMQVVMRVCGALALVAVLLPQVHAQTAPAARNEAGVVDLVEGSVTVTGVDRRSRALRKGERLYEGDAVLTAADGEMHAELTDGGVIAVRPNTQLRITRYQANGEATDTSVFNLVKGSFRSITGWIARGNPAGYQIRTPTTTIGVRGTDHEPLVIAPGAAEGEPGTYDRVHAGTSFIRGANGSVDVGAGRAGFFAHHGRDRPRVLASVPGFFRPAPNERLLEGRHERVRQVLEQKRGERRKFIEERRAQRREARQEGGLPRAAAARRGEGGPAAQGEAGARSREMHERAPARAAEAETRRAQQAAEREARRETLQSERAARQQQQRETRQHREEQRQHREEQRERR